MQRIVLSFIFVYFLMVSCDSKKETSVFEGDNQPETEQPVVAEATAPFTVTVDLKMKQNDALQLYYTETPNGEYSEKMSVWRDYTAPDMQQVVFELPVKPSDIRLDFGKEKMNEATVKSILLKIKDGGELLVDNDSLLNQFFSINEYVEKDDRLNFKFISKDGDKYDPFIYSRDNLTAELQKDLN